MGKKIIGVLATFFMLLSGVSVQAASIKSSYMAEQAQGKAPNITAYVTGSKMQSDVSVSGKIHNISLEQKGKILPFGQSGKNISYIVLIDNSGSVHQAQFEESKNQLISMRQSLKSGDQMTLYTLGTDSPEGEKTKVFSSKIEEEDSRLERDCEKIRGIGYMNTRESMTVLYRSLNQILHEESSPKMRTVVLLITDGEDDSKGKDIDHVSTANTVKEASVPVYGVILSNRKAAEDENILYTKNQLLAEKNCRGYYADCSVSPSVENVQRAFSEIRKLIYEETYVLNLHAATNQTTGRSLLYLEINKTAADPVTMDYSDFEVDDEAPQLVGEIEKTGKNAITFQLQDLNGINSKDAKDKSHYVLNTKSDKDKGKSWTIDFVGVKKQGEKTIITLTTKEDLFTGAYILKCSDIRDHSQNKNPFDDSIEFTIKDGVSPTKTAILNGIKSYGWIGVILIVAVLGILILRSVQKKKTAVGQMNPDDLVKADTKKIRLTITDRSGAIKDVEWDVEGSLFIGRSSICNIYFDDDRLSKQHFVIEVTKMGCYLEDLQSTNGTFVNGVKITNRRMLLDGDTITAGRETIVFHLPKNQSVMETEE